MHTHKYQDKDTLTSVHTYMHSIHSYIHSCIDTCTHKHTYICIYIYIYIYIDTYTRTIPLHISFYLAIRSYSPYFDSIFQWANSYDLTNRLAGRDSRRAVIGYATNSPRQIPIDWFSASSIAALHRSTAMNI